MRNSSDGGGGAEERALSAIRSLPREARTLLAGGVAGMIAKSFVAPLDRIKILYQVTPAHFRLRDVPGAARSIVEGEGWAALWRGNAATMMRVFPYSGIQFMVFDRCKAHFLGERDRQTATAAGGSNSTAMKGTVSAGGDDRKAGLTPSESLLSGMVAGTTSVLCTYPLDLARAQLAVQRKQTNTGPMGLSISQEPKRGVGRILTEGYRRGGAAGLYRGIAPTILGILPYSGAAFAINEQAKRQITHITGRDPTTIERLQCGALSGLFAQTLAYPLEVTRRRMQTVGIVPTGVPGPAGFAGASRSIPTAAHGLNIAGDLSGGAPAAIGGNVEGVGRGTTNGSGDNARHGHRKPPSMVTTMRLLMEEQGVRGFYKGVTMNWVKGPIAFGISFTAFDTIQGWLQPDAEQEGTGRDPQQFAAAGEITIRRRLTSDED